MSVNGITSQVSSAYQTYSKAGTGTTEDTTGKQPAQSSSEQGVTLEVSKEARKAYTPNAALINQLKQDAENHQSKFRQMIADMISKQAGTYGTASEDSIWKFLAGGNFTVDAATKAQAQADIAEDGYWGVDKTSSRIIDFATALTGGDPDKVEEMREAFKKGYAQAEKTWGGQLPEISRKTYDAVMKKFDELAGTTEAEG